MRILLINYMHCSARERFNVALLNFFYQNRRRSIKLICPPFGKELLTRLTICSLCIGLFAILVISRFGFEGGIWGFIAPVPGHGLLVNYLVSTPALNPCFEQNIRKYHNCRIDEMYLGFVNLR